MGEHASLRPLPQPVHTSFVGLDVLRRIARRHAGRPLLVAVAVNLPTSALGHAPSGRHPRNCSTGWMRSTTSAARCLLHGGQRQV